MAVILTDFVTVTCASKRWSQPHETRIEPRVPLPMIEKQIHASQASHLRLKYDHPSAF